MTYRGVLFPLRLKSNGDFETGDQRQLIRADVKMCIWTRRFVSLDIGGERVMRPGAFGIIPTALFKLADMDILVPAYRQWLLEAVHSMVIEGRIIIREVRVEPILTTRGYNGLNSTIAYEIVESGIRDEYESELGTLKPTQDESIWRA